MEERSLPLKRRLSLRYRNRYAAQALINALSYYPTVLPE